MDKKGKSPVYSAHPCGKFLMGVPGIVITIPLSNFVWLGSFCFCIIFATFTVLHCLAVRAARAVDVSGAAGTFLKGPPLYGCSLWGQTGPVAGLQTKQYI